MARSARAARRRTRSRDKPAVPLGHMCHRSAFTIVPSEPGPRPKLRCHPWKRRVTCCRGASVAAGLCGLAERPNRSVTTALPLVEAAFTGGRYRLLADTSSLGGARSVLEDRTAQERGDG